MATKRAAKRAAKRSEAKPASTAKAGSVKEMQQALGKDDHEPVSWAALRAVHGEGGSVDSDDGEAGEGEGDEGDKDEGEA